MVERHQAPSVSTIWGRVAGCHPALESRQWDWSVGLMEP